MRADLLVLSAATLAYGGCKWKLCDMGVASALFIVAAYDYNTIILKLRCMPLLG